MRIFVYEYYKDKLISKVDLEKDDFLRLYEREEINIPGINSFGWKDEDHFYHVWIQEDGWLQRIKKIISGGVEEGK